MEEDEGTGSRQFRTIPLPENLIAGEFHERISRFTALVRVNNLPEKVYLPNTGRLKELLRNGATVYLQPAAEPCHRKTAYEILLIQSGKTLVSIDTRIPNRLLEYCLREHSLPGFERFNLVKREVSYNQSRFDFLLEKDGVGCYVEAKSVTLNKSGVALFPDAPTIRGTKHLHELVNARKCGHEAFVIFLAQRNDSLYFSPNDTTDPDFAIGLRTAIASGVRVHAFRCDVTLRDITILDSIAVIV